MMAANVPSDYGVIKTLMKITTTRENPTSLRIFLCGQLTGEYVSELERVLSPDELHDVKVALDMSNVTFVDREAMMFLCGAKSRVSIENIPSYVLRWIEQEGRCGSSQLKSSEE